MTIVHLSPFEEVLRPVRAEYSEAPSLQLTPSQVQRMFDLEPPACAAVLDALLNESLLSRTHQGLFVRSPITI